MLTITVASVHQTGWEVSQHITDHYKKSSQDIASPATTSSRCYWRKSRLWLCPAVRRCYNVTTSSLTTQRLSDTALTGGQEYLITPGQKKHNTSLTMYVLWGCWDVLSTSSDIEIFFFKSSPERNIFILSQQKYFLFGPVRKKPGKLSEEKWGVHCLTNTLFSSCCCNLS